jgi:hypothetical protein
VHGVKQGMKQKGRTEYSVGPMLPIGHEAGPTAPGHREREYSVGPMLPIGHEVGPTAPGHQDRTRGRPFLAWDAWGRSRGA